jgi:hypothetical protein
VNPYTEPDEEEEKAKEEEKKKDEDYVMLHFSFSCSHGLFAFEFPQLY